jgi:hypothetical protein
MKAYLILVMMFVMSVIVIAEAHAIDDSTSPENAPNFEPTITKDSTNDKVEIIEFKCKLK